MVKKYPDVLKKKIEVESITIIYIKMEVVMNKRKSVFDDIDIISKKMKSVCFQEKEEEKEDQVFCYRESNIHVKPGWVKLSRYNGKLLQEEHNIYQTDEEKKEQDLWHRANIMYSYLIEKQKRRDKVNELIGVQSPYYDEPHLLEPDPDAEYEEEEEEEEEEEYEDEDYESDDSLLDQDYI